MQALLSVKMLFDICGHQTIAFLQYFIPARKALKNKFGPENACGNTHQTIYKTWFQICAISREQRWLHFNLSNRKYVGTAALPLFWERWPSHHLTFYVIGTTAAHVRQWLHFKFEWSAVFLLSLKEMSIPSFYLCVTKWSTCIRLWDVHIFTLNFCLPLC